MTSIGQRFAATGSRPSGFDYLRIFLAVAVIAWHTILACYGRQGESAFRYGPFHALPFLVVPSFFALSGFLVAGSLERNDLPSFLTLRAIRIFPALCVEVLLSAFILGPLLTTVPLGQYFTSPLLAKYLLNVTGYIHYFLPGLFETNPGGGTVNVQLWTVPFELECYVAISLIALVGIFKRPLIMFWILVACSIAICGWQSFTGHLWPQDASPPGRMTVLCFLFGVAIFRLKDRWPWSIWLFAGSLVLSWLCCSVQQLIYLAPLPVAYATIYAGLLNPARTGILKGADYSYGLYLYGFPVQQTVSYLFPAYRHWAFNLIVSLAVTGLFAFMSWTLIESPILGQKKRVLRWVGGLWKPGVQPKSREGSNVAGPARTDRTSSADVSTPDMLPGAVALSQPVHGEAEEEADAS